ncbi:MAG: hypothetical protein JRE13_17225, partial [Deltaproteobacteria bacterium]|nr:hypothetical protein [Deltaproteobacteria bacterium]
MSIRASTEALFGSWSEFVVARRWWVLAAVLAATFGLSPQLANLTVDVSVESYLPTGDPSLIAFERFKRDFGGDSVALVTVETESIFQLETLARLRKLHDELDARVPHTRGLTSLVNVSNIRGEDDELIVEDLAERWPQTADEMPAFRELVLGNQSYIGNFISEDGRYASFILELEPFSELLDDGVDPLDESGFDESFEVDLAADLAGSLDERRSVTPEEETAFTLAVIEFASRYDEPGFRVTVAGIPV